jgi:amidohydrolase
MTTDYHALAQQLHPKLVEWRRDFHQHPELAFEEVRTAGIVASELQALGMEVQTGVGKTGVVGILEGAYDGPTVLLRADMDALPIQEETGAEYTSVNAGKMHACGHDAHTAIALGVAQLLSEQRDKIAGRVKFVFQPAEEIAVGAKAMVDDGVLSDPRPDYTVGLHVWNSLPLGVLGVADGPTMAGASTFSIHIVGKGGHAAAPHLSIDPVVCAAHLITQLQSISSRNVDPFESAVISVTMMRAGTAHNIIPETVELTGTVRTFRREVRDLVVRRMTEITELTCRAMGCEGTFSMTHHTEPVSNDPMVGEKLRPIYAAMPGVTKLDMSVRTMGSEDVGFFMQDIPGLYLFVGAADPHADTYYGHHHPRFTIDEEVLPLGVALLSASVAAYVLPDDHA